MSRPAHEGLQTGPTGPNIRAGRLTWFPEIKRGLSKVLAEAGPEVQRFQVQLAR